MHIASVIKRLKRFVSSSSYFYILLAGITLSCIFFAASISYRIPSDEQFHFEFIEYYANQPIESGPFIRDQGTEYFDLRDITRTPNYLYHYSMSFLLRSLRLVSDSLFMQVFILRLITIAMGVFGLVVVKKILEKINASQLLQNGVLTLVGLTGMFLWLFASITYDVPATVLYLLCVYLAICAVNTKSISTKSVLLYATFAMLCILTKVTFLPFLIILSIITIFLLQKNMRFTHDISFKSFKHILLIVLFVITCFLFIERIGGNIVRYQQIEVSCNRIHRYEDCMQDDVFYRNETQKKIYAQQKLNGQAVTFRPYNFTQMWLALMYERSHFYYGHEQMFANYMAKAFAVVCGALMLIIAIIFHRKIAVNKEERLLLLTAVTYFVIMYIFNLQTYLSYGLPYAFQGRYLLPVLPFMYYFVVKLLILAYRAFHGSSKMLYSFIVCIIFAMSLYLHLPILLFYRGTEAKWYSDTTKSFNQDIHQRLRNIKQI